MNPGELVHSNQQVVRGNLCISTKQSFHHCFVPKHILILQKGKKWETVLRTKEKKNEIPLHYYFCSLFLFIFVLSVFQIKNPELKLVRELFG